MSASGKAFERDRDPLPRAAPKPSASDAAAHGRGLQGYWRTPGVLRTPEGRAAVGLPDNEHFVGLLHLGWCNQQKEPPERAPTGDFVTYLP